MSNRNRQLVTLSLGDLVATGLGTAVGVTPLEDISVLVGGTFVATYSVEVSFDAGATFVAHADFTAQTAPKVAALNIRADQVRLNVTAFTSGTVAGRVAASGPGIV